MTDRKGFGWLDENPSDWPEQDVPAEGPIEVANEEEGTMHEAQPNPEARSGEPLAEHVAQWGQTWVSAERVKVRGK